MGKFITRVHRGDTDLWDRLALEALRLSGSETPTNDAVDRLVRMAGDNPRAFSIIGGRSTKGLHRTEGGQAALRLLARATFEFEGAAR